MESSGMEMFVGILVYLLRRLASYFSLTRSML